MTRRMVNYMKTTNDVNDILARAMLYPKVDLSSVDFEMKEAYPGSKVVGLTVEVSNVPTYMFLAQEGFVFGN